MTSQAESDENVDAGVRRGLLAAAVTACALAAGWCIGAKSIWLDESLSFHWSRLSAGELLHQASVREPNMNLYYLALKAWRLLGDSEAAMRSFSAVAAVLAVPALYAVGRRLFGARTALVAVALLAVHGFLVQYAQQVRGYTWGVLLVLAAAYCFVVGIERPAPRPWLLYGLLMGAAAYVHLFVLFVAVAHCASVFALPRERRPWRHVLVGGIALGVVAWPLLVWSARAGGLNWVQPPTPGAVKDLVQSMAGGDGGLVLVVVAPAWLLGCVRAVVAWRQRARSDQAAWRLAFVVSWLVVPPGLMLAISLVKPIFVPRYAIFSLPAAVLLAAVGLCSLRSRRVFALAMAAAMILSLRSLVLTYRARPVEDWRSAERYVGANQRAGDAVLFSPPYVRYPFEYYALTGGPAVADLPVPALAEHEEVVERAKAETHSRVWLIASQDAGIHGPVARRVVDALRERATVVDQWGFTGVQVTLFEMPG